MTDPRPVLAEGEVFVRESGGAVLVKRRTGRLLRRRWEYRCSHCPFCCLAASEPCEFAPWEWT